MDDLVQDMHFVCKLNDAYANGSPPTNVLHIIHSHLHNNIQAVNINIMTAHYFNRVGDPLID